MATFEYNTLADSVTVKYECPNCGHIDRFSLGVLGLMDKEEQPHQE